MENQNQLPPVQQYPAWDANSEITLTGLEFEAIMTALDYASQGALALQNVVNRHLLNGTIKMKYSKLNAQKNGYEPMTAEESKPYEDEMANMIKTAQDIAAKAKAQAETEAEKPAPFLDAIVNEHGQPYDAPKPNLTVVKD